MRSTHRVAVLLSVVALIVVAGGVADAQSAVGLDCRYVTDRRSGGEAEYSVSIAQRSGPPLPGSQGCRMKRRARQLCVDADVTVSPPPPGTVDGAATGQTYLCYDVRCAAEQDSELVVEDAFGAGPVLIKRKHRQRRLCVPIASPPTSTTIASTSTTTTPSTTTTTTTLLHCEGTVTVDPASEVVALSPGVPADIPVAVTNATGLLDLFLDDGDAVAGTVQCPPSGCSLGGSGDGVRTFVYTPPLDSPATITLTARLSPHRPGFVCGSGGTSTSSKTYPVAP